MVEPEVLDELVRLLNDSTSPTVNTSMRLPGPLQQAAALAVKHLRLAGSTTELTSSALRQVLETAVMAEALEAHYEGNPGARPSLGDVAVALAHQDGSPLADDEEAIRAAAVVVAARHPDADADDVLLWVEAQRAAEPSAA